MAEALLETWMATTVMVVVSISVPVGRKVAAEARKVVSFREARVLLSKPWISICAARNSDVQQLP